MSEGFKTIQVRNVNSHPNSDWRALLSLEGHGTPRCGLRDSRTSNLTYILADWPMRNWGNQWRNQWSIWIHCYPLPPRCLTLLADHLDEHAIDIYDLYPRYPKSQMTQLDQTRYSQMNRLSISFFRQKCRLAYWLIACVIEMLAIWPLRGHDGLLWASSNDLPFHWASFSGVFVSSECESIFAVCVFWFTMLSLLKAVNHFLFLGNPKHFGTSWHSKLISFLSRSATC